jgi:hypothetical protein
VLAARFKEGLREGAAEYPRLIFKPLRYHERGLWRVLGDARLLERLTPNLKPEGGLVVARRLFVSALG